MPSDIFIKTGSSTWSKLTNLFIKTGSSTWSAATAIWAYLQADWVKVWPLSGIFSTRKPWIAASASDTYANRISSGVLRIGTSYYGNNAQWNLNGWTATSYSYAWKYYDSSGTELGTIRSGTGSGWTTTSGQDTLPTSVWTATNSTNCDNNYLGFYVDANASNSAYTGSDVSIKIKVVRQVPLNLTASLSSYTPTVGTQITYSSSWDTSQARKIDTSRTTAYWYKNSTNSTTGGTFIASGYSYTPQASDLGQYIYVVETAYNSGTDYDYGSTTGVQATVITTTTVSQALTAPTSVSLSSVSRASDTTTTASISFSGGSGPYYQLFWTSVNPAPTTALYDAASTGSPITETQGFGNNITYYFYVRSSTENLGNTTTNGSSAAGTYSPYSTAYATYTFQSPSGGSASISGSTSTGSTLSLSTSNPTTAAPSASITAINWRVADGGVGGNSFTGGSVLQSGGSTFVIPATMYGTSTVGYQLRAEVTWNNGVGSQTANSNAITITAPVLAPTNASAPTLSPATINVGTQLSAGIGTWNNSPTNYDIRIYRGTAGVIMSETLVASRSSSSTAALTYTITQADYDSGQRYFRTYVEASNTGGSSGFVAGQERGPAGPQPVSAPVNTASPTISPASPTAGSSTMSTTNGSWSNSPTSYSYQWQVLNSSFTWTNISGATSSTYAIPTNFNTLYSPNYGIRSAVTASNTGGSTTAYSSSVSVNNPAPSGTAPATPTNGGGTYSTGTDYVTNATFTRSASGTTPITYYWTVASSTSQSGPWSTRNSGSFSSSTLGGTATIPQQSWNQSTYGNWSRYQVYASNSVNTSGTLEWLI